MGAIFFMVIISLLVTSFTLWSTNTKIGDRLICWFSNTCLGVDLSEESDDEEY